MVWVHLAVVAVFFNVALSQSIRCPINKCAPKLATTIAPTVVPTIAPTIVDGNVVQSLIDTIQLFIVSDLLADTLPEKKCYIQTIPEPPCLLEYDDSGVQYELIFDSNCTGDLTTCVNCDQLILPPYAAELPCGLGYMPGGLPVVAKAFAPCSKGCGCGCSAGALPICSPYSYAALSVPLCPNMSPCVKPIIL
ncbi:uncharacterized protein LOC134752743 [Cydia strobilella]|uniref:uncharacterized protein LOC134752743 n=1 Tax=Cydia strobilella TaxID=1100964 RepID=UPI003004D4F7